MAGLAVTARIIIVGGGFTGAATAIQLARRSPRPLDIAIVEPRAQLGSGLAYASSDPDHRLNGSAGTHYVDPADPAELTRWCEATRLLERDPQALAQNGQLYIRRADFARFLAHTLEACARMHRSTIRHVRERAVDACEAHGGLAVVLQGGERLDADRVVLATGNGAMRMPRGLAGKWMRACVIGDPLAQPQRIRAIPARARVLVVGAGLTALDILSTLLRQRHEGPIVALSRHGLRPRPQRPPNPDAGAERLLERIDGPLPGFIGHATRTARGFTRALRTAIRESEAAGGDWYTPFDQLRDPAAKAWRLLDSAEKRRFLRWLRPFYDVHRFRTPPQNDALVREAEARGAITFVRGKLEDVAPERFDIAINCAGLDASCGARDNPLLRSLVARGMLRADPAGIGFEVDDACRPVGRGGGAVSALRMIGPPTAGTCGDPLGVLFIAPQVARVVGSLVAGFERDPASAAIPT